MHMQIPWTKVWGTVITGLGVVFLALVLLILFVSLFGLIFQNIEKAKQQKAKAAAPSPAPAAPVKPAPVIEAAKTESDDDVIAVISAAVAMMSEQDGKNYAVKSIKRAVNKRTALGSVWGSAGQRENTRPF